MEDIISTNERLKERYGRMLDGRNRFRIVMSDEQLEWRHGVFTDFYGHIIIRTVKELRRVRKYPYLDPPCFVLEKLVFYPNSEVPDSIRGGYECAWAFRSAKGQPLEPTWRAIEVIMWHILNPTKRYDSDFKADQAREDKEEIAKFMDVLDNEGRAPWAAFENAVNVSTNQLEFRKQRKEKS